MPDIYNVRVYQYGNFGALIHTFPQGHVDNPENDFEC